MDKKRIICLDVGDRRIGIAVSDPLGLTAQPVETYTRVGYGPDTKKILVLADQYGTDQVLCGLPRNMDGSEGFQVDKVREFAGKLEEAGLTVSFYDERMTTIQAESILLEGGLHRGERKRKVDMVAAVMILQSYLDAETRNPKESQFSENTDTDEVDADENIWMFEDENGSPVQLHLIYELSYEGTRYLLFNDVDDPNPDADFIVMAEKSEEGEAVFESVDDEKLLEHIYEQYVRNSDQ